MVGIVQGKEINLKGKFVNLRSINESDFARLIEWRNNPEINRYLNQPYKLTIELQYKWYKKKYLNSNDILFIVIELKNKKRIGTIGINDVDYKNHTGIAGRLLIGEKEYRGSKELVETNILFYDYLFYILKLKKLYCHVVIENKKVVSFDKKYGFTANRKTIFPQYCNVDGMKLIEMVNTKEQYEKAKKKIEPIMRYFKTSKILNTILF
jgi:RimJ/RimL family protein N-acetyltransferase